MARDDHHGINDQFKASQHRRDDAQVLFHGARWRASMYLGGYAVECLLKARLMKRYGVRTLADLDQDLKSRGLIAGEATVYSHEIEWLFRITGDQARIRSDRDAWKAYVTVNRWGPEWRYDPDLSGREEAEDFLDALDRVLSWLRAHP
ncbi:hypothetical protein TA3x_002112 [Tundrisphaera sp. TA3]|uniref:hypothetical protein n=1 Tax=Tundrisphaera sp. TA3 TaxID=3435775 RepID=UPI003EBB6EEE